MLIVKWPFPRGERGRDALGERVTVGRGMEEMGAVVEVVVVVVDNLNALAEEVAASTGRMIKGMECMIVDEQDRLGRERICFRRSEDISIESGYDSGRVVRRKKEGARNVICLK